MTNGSGFELKLRIIDGDVFGSRFGLTKQWQQWWWVVHSSDDSGGLGFWCSKLLIIIIMGFGIGFLVF